MWLDRLDPDYPHQPPPEPRPKVDVHCEPTPNPEAMKFVTSTQVPTLTPAHPLQRALLEIDGVKSVFAIDDFVTVTRTPGQAWNVLIPRVEGVLRNELART